MGRERISPVRAAKRRSVQVCGDRLIKRQSSLYSRLERERSRVGARLGAACGLFDVPEVLSFDDAAGEIVFRFVKDAIPLRTYFPIKPCADLAERCGRALAYIHAAGSSINDGDLFWHGDYGMGNLLYSEAVDRLTIVDWSNAQWAGVSPHQSKGPAGLDLGIAILSLFHHRIAYRPCVLNPERLAEAFLRGYSLGRPCFRLAAERPFLSEIHARRRIYYLSRWGIIRTMAVMPSWFRALRFLSLMEGDV